MLSGGPLGIVSLFLTYFVQITLAYLAVVLACALIRTPRIRLRAWAAVLVFTVLRWLMLCANTTTPAAPAAFAGHVRNVPALDWSWPVMAPWAPFLAVVAIWGARLYVAALAIVLLRLLWTWLRLQILLHSGDSPSPALHAVFEDLCRQTKVRRCRISLIADLPSPATAGWWRPQVLLPANLVSQLSPTELGHVLRHELTHVKRRDYLWDLLASFACRLVFFHPAAWLAYRKLRWERELYCDQAVVHDSQEVRLQYAECLVKLARGLYVSQTRSPEGIGLAASPSQLTIRVRALLSEPPHPSVYARLSRACLTSAVVLLSVCLLPAVGLTLYWSAPRPSLSSRARNTSPVRRTMQARKASQPNAVRSVPENTTAKPEIPSAETVPSILSGLNSRPLPVLATPSDTEPGTVNPPGSPASSTQRGASVGAWDESPMPLASAPNWQKLATDAITRGVAAIGQAGGGGDPRDGQSDQQGNH
jgi:beta-lactamase regulating signal transducer with metallopeptidase domain